MWDACLLLGKEKKTQPAKELFPTVPTPTTLPALEYGKYEDALDEMKILGFPHTSPFSLLAKNYRGTIYADELMKQLGNVVFIVGYYVNTKDLHTVHGDHMSFGTFIDGKGKLFDTVHFPQSLEKYRFEGKGCYIVKGTVIEDFGVPSIDVVQMQRIHWAFNS